LGALAKYHLSMIRIRWFGKIYLDSSAFILCFGYAKLKAFGLAYTLFAKGS
jgi:hypothetical protein